MPSVTVPLVGTFNARGAAKTIGSSSKDQQFINCYFEATTNKFTGNSVLSVLKLPAYSTGTQLAASKTFEIMEHALGSDFANVYAASNGTQKEIYAGSTFCGIIGTLKSVTQQTRFMASGKVNGTQFVAFVSTNLTDSEGIGWFLMKDAYTTSLTFTGDTHANTTIDNISSMTGLYVGQAISGTGIQAGTRIESINVSGSSITTTLATTGTASITVTREAIAKVIDADWPSSQIPNSCAFMDGYVFWGCKTGRIYQSALNDPSSIGASDYLEANSEGDLLSNIIKVKSTIYALGYSGSWESYVNRGNPSGSVLSRSGIGSLDASTSGRFTYYGGYAYIVCNIERKGDAGVYRILDGGIEKVSDSTIGRIIKNTNYGIVGSLVWGINGFLVISGAQNSILYNLSNNTHTECSLAITGAFNKSITLATDSVYTVSSDDEYVSGSPNVLTTTIQTSRLDYGTENLKTIDKVSLLGTDIQSSGTATLEYSDDDYATWTTAGTFDLTTINPFITRCGAHRSGRAWRITHSANTAFRAQSLKFDYSVGEH